MIGQLHRAEWHHRVLAKPYGDCLNDHGGRRTVHRAARRLDREIVRAEVESLPFDPFQPTTWWGRKLDEWFESTLNPEPFCEACSGPCTGDG